MSDHETAGTPGDALVIEWRLNNGGECRIVHQDDLCGLPACECGRPKPSTGRGECYWCRSHACAKPNGVIVCHGCHNGRTDGRSHPYCPDCQRKHATKGRSAEATREPESERTLTSSPRERPTLPALLKPRHPMPTASEAHEYLESVRRDNARRDAEERWPCGAKSSDRDRWGNPVVVSRPRPVCLDCGGDHAGPPAADERRSAACDTCGCRVWGWSR
jgi:uncharacterized Zn finger protein (UPF0148 family)